MNDRKITVESLYEEYSGKIKSYIMSRISNIHDAEDLVSDVFLKISEHFADYDASKSSYSTWIYVITQNTVRDYFRRFQNNKNVELPDELPLPDLNADVEGKLLNEEMLETLAVALDKLSERERDIIILRFYKGIPAKEVAEMLDISYANVRYIQSVTLKKLRTLLPQDIV